MRIIFCLYSLFLIACVSETESVKETKNQDPIVVVSELIDKDITNDSLYVERAKINIDRKRFKEALKDLDQANSLDSTKGETHYLLADVLLELVKSRVGDDSYLVLSSEHFYTSVRYNYNIALSYKKAGEIYLFRGKTFKNDEYLNTSVKLLEESIFVNSSDPHTFLLLGYCYIELDREEEAILCFNKTVELDSNNEEGYLQLGNLHHSLQDSLSLDYYNKVVKINPENRIAWYNMGLAYHSNSMYSEAQEVYHKIIDIGIEDRIYENATYNLGFMFEDDLKDYKNAINYFIEVLRVNPNYYLAYFRMAICYQGLGDVVNAEQYYRKALGINPNFKEANDRLKKLLSDNKKYK